jgi:hypothetical protein
LAIKFVYRKYQKLRWWTTVVNQLPNKASSAGDARSDKPAELAEVTELKEHSMAALIGCSARVSKLRHSVGCHLPARFPKMTHATMSL